MPDRDSKGSRRDVSEAKSMASIEMPGWIIEVLRQRKDQATLTPTEQKRFLCAFSTLNITARSAKMVQIHSQIHNQHGTRRSPR